MVLNQIGSFRDLFFLPQASGANFQKGLDQIVAGMWIIIQCTYLASRVLKKTTCSVNAETFSSCACLKHFCNIQYGSHLISQPTSQPTFPCFMVNKETTKDPVRRRTPSSIFFSSLTNACPFFFMLPFIFGPINYVWHTTIQVSHTLAAVFLSVTVFLISHENDLRNSSYPLAVFSTMKQSLLLPPRGSFLLIECLYDSLLCTEKLHVL